ncbi:MAG: single-stranded DNA-binding protein [Cyanobacteria bacterium REEB65]|nr:single-stranded DNA-binding protein [Cyanobacteria bacterium REEB65]
MALNHIVLVGTIDRAPERRMTPEGFAVTSFKLKVVRPVRQEGTPAGIDYIPILATRRLADSAAELPVGEVVAVEGRLVTRTIEQNGQRQKIVEVDASNVQRIAANAAMPAADFEAVPVASGVVGQGEPDLDTDIPF